MPRNFCIPAPAKTPGPGSFPHEAESVMGYPALVQVPGYAVLGVLNVLISVFCGIAGTGIPLR